MTEQKRLSKEEMKAMSNEAVTRLTDIMNEYNGRGTQTENLEIINNIAKDLLGNVVYSCLMAVSESSHEYYLKVLRESIEETINESTEKAKAEETTQ